MAFISVNTDDGRVAATRVDFDGAVVHTAVAPAVKAPLLKHFGIRRVPHIVLLGRDGQTLLNGSEFSWDKLGDLVGTAVVKRAPPQIAARAPAAPAAPAPVPAVSAFSIDEDF